MADLDFRWERRTIVPPERAIAWWFDVRADDHQTPEHEAIQKHPPKPGDGRRILTRSSTEVVVEDVWRGRPPMRSTLRLEGRDAYAVEGGGKGFSYKGAMRAEPDGEGARLVYTTTTHIGGFFGLLAPLFGKSFEKTIAMDLEAHAKHMEREWRERPW